ncbi:hypothetical protein BGZ72_004291 [Mortierella alpina]|nr:hypothetical protein BGZ72_004291 [Mortierella alpina]
MRFTFSLALLFTAILAIIPSVLAGCTKVYVGNLDSLVGTADLEDIFREFNPKEITIVRDCDSGASRGFAYVTFADGTDGDSAIETLNGYELHGKDIRVQCASQRGRRGMEARCSY